VNEFAVVLHAKPERDRARFHRFFCHKCPLPISAPLPPLRFVANRRRFAVC
jgi:hypothetical protein